MDTQEKKPQHRIPWIAIVLGLLALLAFFFTSDRPYEMRTTSVGFGISDGGPIPPTMPMRGEVNSADIAVQSSIALPPGMPYPYYGGNPSAKDTREFNKVYYNATMRTRDVPGLTRRAETTIRGHGGRIDQESSSEKNGYISFVIPADKYERFRTEIESFVSWRFLSVSISSQNLLPQKQSIEQMQKDAEKYLADAQAARKKAVSAHANVVASLNAEIDTNSSTLASLRASGRNDPVTLSQISNLENTQASLRAQLSNENAAYNSKIASYDQQIKYANDSLAGVKQQDQNLLDNVATVNGTLSFNWISLWDIVRLYLPGYSIPAILAGLAILAYLFERRRSAL